MATTASAKLPHLEGLRGLSAFWVVVAHLYVMFRLPEVLPVAGPEDGLFGRLLGEFGKLPKDGHLPVFVFWFLSALVISLRIHRPEEPDPVTYIRLAALKRYFRLTLPLAAASLLSFILMKADAFDHHWLATQPDLTGHPEWLTRWFNFEPSWWNFFKVTFADVYLIQNSNYDFPLWTISPELFGPLMVFAVYLLFHRILRRHAIYLTILSALFIGALSVDAYSYYFMFLAGYLYAYVYHSSETMRLRTMLNSALLAWAGLLLTFVVPLLITLPAALDTFLRFPLRAIMLTLAVTNTGWLKRALSVRPLSILGAISFSLYLIHIPILFSLGIHLARSWVQPGLLHPVALCGILVVLLFAISYLFYRFIDVPSQRFAGRFAVRSLGETTTRHTPNR